VREVLTLSGIPLLSTAPDGGRILAFETNNLRAGVGIYYRWRLQDYFGDYGHDATRPRGMSMLAILGKEAEGLLEAGRTGDAARLYKLKVQLLQRVFRNYAPIDLVSTQTNVGACFAKEGEYWLAEMAFEEALRFCEGHEEDEEVRELRGEIERRLALSKRLHEQMQEEFMFKPTSLEDAAAQQGFMFKPTNLEDATAQLAKPNEQDGGKSE